MYIDDFSPNVYVHQHTAMHIHLFIFTFVTFFILTSNNFNLAGKLSDMILT